MLITRTEGLECLTDSRNEMTLGTSKNGVHNSDTLDALKAKELMTMALSCDWRNCVLLNVS